MSTPSKYKDSTVRIWGRFWNADTNAPADPGLLHITVLHPDGVTVRTDVPDSTIVHVSTGVYYLKLPLALLGKYRWKWLAEEGTDYATAIMGALDSVTRGGL